MGGLRLLSASLLLTILAGCGDDASKTKASLFSGRKPDAELESKGVSARVEIARDEYGVPHVYAPDLASMAFGQGYAHARDRFFQMDLYRHLVEGRLSEYFGALTESIDVDNLSNMLTTDGVPVWDAMAKDVDDADRVMLAGYAAGVNLYIAKLRNGEVPKPVGYDSSLLAAFQVELVPDWRIADTFAIGRLQEMNLSDSSSDEMSRGDARSRLPAELYEALLRHAPPDPIAILPGFYDSPFAPGRGCKTLSGCTASTKARSNTSSLYSGIDFAHLLERAKKRDAFGMRQMPDAVAGSNNWVVSGKLTDTGKSLVMNDPHLRFYLPSLFYHSHTDDAYYASNGGGASEIGISFPGIPGTLIGHNEHVAWGATTTGWDVTDVYVETLNDAGDATLFNGDYVPLKEVTIAIQVLTDGNLEGHDHVFEIVPHHGVIVPDSKTNGKALTRKWTGHAPRNGLGAIRERRTAKNIDEFMTAMSHFVAGAQNWNGADTDGNTGYMPGALVPVRASVTGDCDPSVPMDGTGPCEWTGFIPENEIPRVKNRANGYVVTANNDVTGTLADNDPTNDPQYLMSDNADGFRAQRITDRLEELIAKGKIKKSDMVALQADTVSLEAKRLLPFVLDAASEEAVQVKSLGLQDAIDRLSGWDFSTPSGVAAEYRTDGGPSDGEIRSSVAAALYNTFRAHFFTTLFAPVKKQYDVDFYDVPAALYVLENPAAATDALFDDATTDAVETKNDVILKALADAVSYLRDKLGDDSAAWRWGAIHQLEVRDAFGDFGVLVRKLGPLARGGANSTIDVAGTGSSTDDFTYTAGPMMRFVAEVGDDGITSANSLPGGQVDDPDSPHYQDLLPLWLRNETFPYYFRPADVVEHTEELVVITPTK